VKKGGAEGVKGGGIRKEGRDGVAMATDPI
jgi:hypothetical protein